jgi:hypothetical protein
LSVRGSPSIVAGGGQDREISMSERRGDEATSDGRHDARIGARWGPRVDTTELRELYAPQKVEPFVVPSGGIDNLALHSTDVFPIRGQGDYGTRSELTVDFQGYFRVPRDPRLRDLA